MANEMNRRELFRLAGFGGLVFASAAFPGLVGCGTSSGSARGGAAPGTPRGAAQDFFFLQLSDTHWGFSDPTVNPESATELPSVIAEINAASVRPDFVVFTGDLTQTTDDVTVRRQRMTEFKQLVADLNVPIVKFMPGEHDAAPDAGAAYKDFFGELHYSFDHKGVHFVVLDNVSSPTATVGDAQIAWLKSDLAHLDADAPIVLLTHRPLWDLKPEWDWATTDGAKVLDVVMPFHNVVVFFGHIHQELHHMTGHIAHHSARSLMFALPTPETPGNKVQVPWDPNQPNAGLGYRRIEATQTAQNYDVTELPAQTKDG
jgi:3',5'-cyclic AMP phosphodiesterase CpdA